MLVGIAGAESAGREDLVDRGEIGLGEGDVGRVGVFLHAAALRVPGIGTMCSPWASSQARASWETVMLLAVASRPSRSTASTFFSKLPGCQRGLVVRMSVASYCPAGFAVPVMKPRPRGE
ncbi:MAG: hypothetical protein ABIQ18_40895 [Umezawaea sp.]